MRFPIFLPAVLIAVLASTAPARSVQTAAVAPVATPEAQLQADAADGRLDRFTLLEAAIIAGGVHDPARRAAFISRWQEIENAIIPNAAGDGPLAQAEQALQQLYAQALTGQYFSRTSDVTRTITAGDYNCLSATILYLTLVRRGGLTATAVAREGHVLARVQEGDTFDVETTCRGWFDENAHPTASSSLRCLSDVQLIAKVYYNRGVGLLESGNFVEGLRLTRISCQLDGDDQLARGNLLAGLNNWALTLSKSHHHEQAAALLAELQRYDPHYPTLRENQLYVYQQWSASLRSRGQYARAREVFSRTYALADDAQ